MKYEIEIEGLPEGWKPIAYRLNTSYEHIYDHEICEVVHASCRTPSVRLIVEKIKPRRIVLEETKEGIHDVAFHDDAGLWTYWREVKEEETK